MLKDLRRRIDFIRKGSEVERWHTLKMLQTNDVGHHSFHVAWFAYLLMEDCDDPQKLAVNGIIDVIMAALSHDLAEQVTGDVPGDFKRDLEISEQFGSYEMDLLKRVRLSNFTANLYEPGQRIVNFADMLDGIFFTISEASLGNRRVGVVFHNYRSYIEKLRPFSKTEAVIVEYVDELWAHYGRSISTGQYMGNVPVWGSKPQSEEPMQEQETGLTAALRREEAEGRATPPLAGDQPADPSKAAKRWDMLVPEQPVNEPTDDRAQPDLAAERPSSPANARQHGGDHYKGVGYEHWDLVLDTGMNYFQGCATKYVTRWRKHDAGEVNLMKAIHYVDKLQEALLAGRIRPEGVHSVADIVRFGVANGLNELEVLVIKDVVGWRLDNAREHLARLRAGYTSPEVTGGRAYYGEVEGS